jgi:hypothetical protein
VELFHGRCRLYQVFENSHQKDAPSAWAECLRGRPKPGRFSRQRIFVEEFAMLPLISVTSRFSEPPIGGPIRGKSKWSQKAWQEFVDWLLEPIPFPGKCDINFDRQKSYNKEDQATPTSAEVDDR